MATDELKRLLKEQKQEKKNLKKSQSEKKKLVKSNEDKPVTSKIPPKKDKTAKEGSFLLKKDKTVKKENIASQSDSESLYASFQSVLPIKSINNGCIHTTYNTYVRILEIEPIAFALKTPKEKADIIETYYKLLKVAPGEFTVKSISQKVDISDMIKNIMEATKNETSELFIKRRNDYINLLKECSSAETLSRRYFFIFKISGRLVSSEADAVNKLTNMANKLIPWFRKCGCPIIQHSNESLFAAETLYMLLNRKTVANETYQQRLQRVINDMLLINGQDKFKEVLNELNLLDCITSRGFDATHKDYVSSDGLFYQYLYVDGDTIPAWVEAGFMDNFTSCAEMVDVDFFVKKEDRQKTIKEVSRTNLFAKADTNSSNADKADSGIKDYQNTSTIKKALRDGGEELYSCSIIITVMEETLTGLKAKANKIIEDFSAYDIAIKTLPYRNQDMFFDTLPLCHINKTVAKKSSRNFLTSSLAAAFMFTCFSLYNPNGILIGVNNSNRTILAINPFDTSTYANANLTVLGVPGAGKTFFLLSLSSRMRMQGIKTLFVLPVKGFEFKKNILQLGGSFISLAPMSPNVINPLELYYADNPNKEFLEDDYNDMPILARKINSLITFLYLLSSTPLTDEERNISSTALLDLYNRFGFTEDNNSIFDENGNKKIMPTFGDWQEECKKYPKLERVVILLDPFVHGQCRNMNAQTNVDCENMMTAFDVTDAGTYLVPFFYIAIDYCYNVIKRDRTEMTALFLDEVWNLMKDSSEMGGVKAAELVMECSKIVRGFAGSLITSTQNLSDWFGFSEGKYGKAIINNSPTKIILKCGDEDADSLQKLLKLTDQERNSLTKFERAQGLLISNKDKIPAYFASTQLERETFSTDHNQLREMVNKMKSQK